MLTGTPIYNPYFSPFRFIWPGDKARLDIEKCKNKNLLSTIVYNKIGNATNWDSSML